MKLTRRDFSKLTATAFGGVIAGTIIGCGGDDEASSSDTVSDGDVTTPTDDDSSTSGEQKLAGAELPEHNACLGLNQCKEFGKNAEEHDCAGRGSCATVTHDCLGMNSCKYLGACDGKVGANQCKQQGGCQVPMTPGEERWLQARAAFEKRMKAKETEVGIAPL